MNMPSAGIENAPTWWYFIFGKLQIVNQDVLCEPKPVRVVLFSRDGVAGVTSFNPQVSVLTEMELGQQKHQGNLLIKAWFITKGWEEDVHR